MAHRSRRNTDPERDDPDPIASLLSPVAPPGPSVLSPGLTPREVFNEIEDRRTYTPDDPFRSPMLSSGLVAGYSSQPRATQNRARTPIVRFQPAFDKPAATLVCVRRKERREVIFAHKKHRKGAGARRRRRNWLSDIRC